MDNQNSEHRLVDIAENKGGGEVSDYDRLLAELAPPACPIIPKSDLVLLVQDAAANFIGKILVPDNVKNKPHRGVIVAVGPGYLERETGQFLPMKTKVGERVLFGQYSGTPFIYLGTEYLLMRESDLYGQIPAFSLEELQAMKEAKDVADAEVSRLAQLRAEHLARGGSIDTLPQAEGGPAQPEQPPVLTQSDGTTSTTVAPSGLSLDTNINAAKPPKPQPKIKGRR